MESKLDFHNAIVTSIEEDTDHVIEVESWIDDNASFHRLATCVAGICL